MAKPGKQRKGRTPPRPGSPAAPGYSAEAQEVRALLRRVPDGFQAALHALASRPEQDRERVMHELVRGMGREILPLLRAAALGKDESLGCSAMRVLPVFGTRAAGLVLEEAYAKCPEGERGRLIVQGAQALAARGVRVAVEPEAGEPEAPRYALRETSVSAPDGVGSRSVAARLQDQYGVWHAILVMWNDRAGVKDGFMRPFSRKEWEERLQRLEGGGLAQVTCPPDYARWQVAQARRLNEQTGFPLGESLRQWDELVGDPPDGYVPPDPVEHLAGAPPEQVETWLNEGGQLFRIPEVRSWFLELADCVNWARRWDYLQSRLLREAPAEADRAALDALVGDAAAELLTPQQVMEYRGRLLDLSRVLEWSRETAGARRAAALAAALEVENEPAVLPFFRSLVERSLQTAAALLRQGEDLERGRYRPLRRYQP